MHALTSLRTKGDSARKGVTPLADQKWQGGVTATAPIDPMQGQMSGVESGFDAYVFNSPDMIADPAIARTVFAGAQAGWTADAAITGIAQTATPAGGPSGAFSLSVNEPANTIASVYSAMIVPIKPDVVSALATSAFLAGPQVYTSCDFWAQNSLGITGSILVNLLFEFYDSSGAFLGSVGVGGGLPGEAANTWGHSSTVNINLFTGTFNNKAALSRAAFCRAALQLQNGNNNPNAWLLTNVHVSLPSLQQGAGLQVSVTPGIFNAGGQREAYTGGVQTLNAADPAQNRTDLLAWDWLTQTLVYVAGVPGGGVPAMPDLCSPLWDVLVPAGATQLTFADLTDVREHGAVWVDNAGNVHITGVDVDITASNQINMNGAKVTANGSVIPAAGQTSGNPVAFANTTTQEEYITAGGTSALSTGFGVNVTANTANTKIHASASVGNTTANGAIVLALWRSTIGVPAANAAKPAGDAFIGQREITIPAAWSAPNGAVQFALDIVDTGAVVGTTYWYYLTYACMAGNGGQPLWLPNADNGFISAQSI